MASLKVVNFKAVNTFQFQLKAKTLMSIKDRVELQSMVHMAPAINQVRTFHPELIHDIFALI